LTAVPLTSKSEKWSPQPWRIPVAAKDYEDNPAPHPALVDRWGDSLPRVEQMRALDVSRAFEQDGSPCFAGRLRRGILDQIRLAAAEFVNPTR
jgi:hypothetical protein